MVTSRAKDLIIRNGENISPKEIEDLLITEPNIADIAVVGLPDPRTGDAPVPSSFPAMARRRTSMICAGCWPTTGWRRSKAPEEVAIWDTLAQERRFLRQRYLKHRIRAQLMEERACQ